MAVWLIVAIERLPARVRRFSVAAASALALAGAIVALTLLAGSGSVARRRVPTPVSAPHQNSERPVPRSVGAPVSASGLQRADLVAGRFLATYLPFAYGRASAGSVAAITSGLRRQLLGVRVRATPVERRRQPRVVSLRLVGMVPGFALAGGIAAYRLRFTLQKRAAGWSVTRVLEG
jgi:NADPH:quinone reductase-like Zn-dependent oxidoreductase